MYCFNLGFITSILSSSSQKPQTLFYSWRVLIWLSGTGILKTGPFHRSDHDCQYTSLVFQKGLRRARPWALRENSRDALDNTVAERGQLSRVNFRSQLGCVEQHSGRKESTSVGSASGVNLDAWDISHSSGKPNPMWYRLFVENALSFFMVQGPPF